MAHPDTHPTLMDIANLKDPEGGLMAVAEILNEVNEITPEMVMIECNNGTSHRTGTRTGIPQPTWRKINAGVQVTKAHTAPATFSTGRMEDFAEIDKVLADLESNKAAYMATESSAHIEGIAQEFADSIFYASESTEPEAITGLANYYNDLSAESADNIIDAGGTGSDNGSIWLVGWGPTTIFGIYPKGLMAGLEMDDLGEDVLENAGGVTGARMRIYRVHFAFNTGLAVRDWRFAVRIANIDKSDLSLVYDAGAFSTGAHLPNLMFQAMRLIPSFGLVRPAFYMSRDMATTLAQQTVAIGQNGLLRTEEVGGSQRFTERFNGIPVRRCDALSANEAQVT